MLAKLQAEIIREKLRGIEDLPPRDRSPFSQPLAALLNKSVATKQAWIDTVTSTRNRQACRRSEAADAQADSDSRNTIIQWSRTGLLSQNITNNN
jgi:hypothetical protein